MPSTADRSLPFPPRVSDDPTSIASRPGQCSRSRQATEGTSPASESAHMNARVLPEHVALSGVADARSPADDRARKHRTGNHSTLTLKLERQLSRGVTSTSRVTGRERASLPGASRRSDLCGSRTGQASQAASPTSRPSCRYVRAADGAFDVVRCPHSVCARNVLRPA
jgi:hypothetical protein